MQRSRRPCPAHPQVPGLSEYLELVPLEPESLRSEVASLMAADFALCWVLEKTLAALFRF